MDKAIHDCEFVTSFCLIDDYTLDYDHSWVKLCMSSRHSSTLGLFVNYWKFSEVTHYHLQVQPNPKKIVQKNQCYFSLLTAECI